MVANTGGTYDVTVTELSGCQGTATISINTLPGLNVTITPGVNTVCVGATTTLTASGADNYSVLTEK